MFSVPRRSGIFVAVKVLLQIQSSGTLLPHTQQVHRSQSLVTCDCQGNGTGAFSGMIVQPIGGSVGEVAPDGGVWNSNLMLLGFGCRASLADALHLNSKLFQLETRRKFAAQFHRTQRIEVQVGNGPATRGDQMVVGMVIGVDAPRAIMRANFAQHAGMHEGLEVLVNPRE